MSVSSIKLSKFNEIRKTTAKQISEHISTLNSLASDALVQQAYMRINPDENGADTLLVLVDSEVNKIAIALSEVQSKLADVLSVKSGTMSIEDTITKYNINLTDYSDGLV